MGAAIVRKRWMWWSSELAILLCILWSGHVVVASGVVLSSSTNNDDPISSIVTGPEVELNPTVEYLGPYRTTTLWQMPPGPVERVLFLAIGSGMLPWDFWDRTPSCPLCRGMYVMKVTCPSSFHRVVEKFVLDWQYLGLARQGLIYRLFVPRFELFEVGENETYVTNVCVAGCVLQI